jgi:outer membrane protein assembly factor BamE (lipoprotein component of BamABCDE complex)
MTMTIRLTACLALAVALVAAGCAGADFAKQTDDGFVLGQTTRQDILQRLGTPYREGTATKNGKQLKTLSYAFGTTVGKPVRDGVIPTRGQGFYFLDDKLAGYDFASSWKEDQTDFNGAKVSEIKKGVSTRDDVVRMIGRPGGRYAYPLIADQNRQAEVYLYAESRGGPINVKFYQKHLIVTYDERGVVSNVDYQELGQKDVGQK